MSVPNLHVAIDLGASSARMFGGNLQDNCLEIREISRVPNGPVQLPDGIHWDVLRVYQVMLESLGRLSLEAEGSPVWVGIDGWGVDYGLLDHDGRLLGLPFHYRDDRTAGRLNELNHLVGLDRMYEATGIQEMEINTVCQLLSERESGAYSVASGLLMVPDLFAYLLTGELRLERTNASTTQLADPYKGTLLEQLFPLLGLRPELFAPAIEPGEHYGAVLPKVGTSVGMRNSPSIVAVASHDTASAVLAVPAVRDDIAYVVSGTWSIVGVELAVPIISKEGRQAGFSNEAGYGGAVLFLKNVMGHWMLQECQRCWAQEGRSTRIIDLIAGAEAYPPFRYLVDTTDPVFAVPGDMPRLIREACVRDGMPVPESDPEVVRCVLDSMALAICRALEEAQSCSGKQVSIIHVVGGGSANSLLPSLLAACAGLEVVAGPTEASAIGNLLVQLHAAGRVGDQIEMRELVARSFGSVHVRPDPTLAHAAQRAKAWSSAYSHQPWH